MASFHVKLKNMNETVSLLQGYGKELEGLADSVLNIYSNLSFDTSQKDALIRSLNRASTNILGEAVKMENLSKALIYICEEYKKHENLIIDDMNGELGFLDKVINKLKEWGMTLLDKLGLSQMYYSHEAGYEGFEEDKVQEKFMDEYMQTTIWELMDQEYYSKDHWYNATKEERKEILTSLLAEINRINGLSVNENINYEKIKIKNDIITTGYYYKNEITINELYLDREDSYDILKTIIHEMRHAYQHDATDNPEDFCVSEETMDEWADNFDDYKNATTDGYEAYASQAIEYDAKSFAKQDGDLIDITPEYAGSWE